LLTNNTVISYAARVYEEENWKFKGAIPVCLTDFFLSAILWANYPNQSENINIKRLMVECSSITELDNKLLERYYNDVYRMHKEHAISDEQFYLLSASNVAYSLLEERTLNDVEVYTDLTPREILEELEFKINRQLEEEKMRFKKAELRLTNIANIVGRVFFFALALLIMILLLAFKWLIPAHIKSIYFFVPVCCVSSILLIFGILRWAEIIPTKSKIESSVSGVVYNFLKKLVFGS
jgi:hypothetical protein